MASAWGASWGAFWGNSWGSVSTPVQPEAPVSGGGGWYFNPETREQFYERRALERAKLRLSEQVPEVVTKQAEKAVSEAISQQQDRKRQIDLRNAEMELRALLAQLQIEWRQEYARALLIEYELALLELEEEQIVWLLFEI